VRVFRLLHTLHIGHQFSESSGTSNTLLILRVMGLTERALLVLVIFLDLLSLAGLLENSLQLPNPPERLSM
jgi:hypothetical protein